MKVTIKVLPSTIVSPQSISPARRVAFAVLRRVEDGSWAQEVLLSQAAHLDSRDAGLASEIVYGVLRRQAQLDWLIEQTSKRRVSSLDPEVLIATRMGVYQLRHLDRVPPHAAVHDSVELIKAARKRSAAGFVNAILRRVPKQDVKWPTEALLYSEPAWLFDRWIRQYGRQTATGIGAAFLEQAPTFVRNPPLDRPGLTVEPTDVSGAFRVLAGDTTGLRIQDAGSQAIVPLLDLQPGQRFLDLCSAPGNKTAQALEYGVSAIASDFHLHRLRSVTGCPRVVLDATRALPFGRQFDRVLIDAPCSGTGTLSRNPEIRWRVQPSDILELQAKQVAILRNGLESLRPGGRLVYSTCSLEGEENRGVVAAALEGSRFLVEKEIRRIPGREVGDGFFAAVITSE